MVVLKEFYFIYFPFIIDELDEVENSIQVLTFENCKQFYNFFLTEQFHFK